MTKYRRMELSAGLDDSLMEFYEFDPKAPPFDIERMREDLTYLGEWMTMKKREDHYGFFYRFGVKSPVLDAQGDVATAFLHFVVPFAEKGHSLTPEMEREIDEGIERVINQSTKAFSLLVNNAIGVRANPTKRMVDELKEILRQG